MKIIRQTSERLTRMGLVSDAWFTESKQNVIKEIGKENYLKLKKDKIFKSDFATFKII
mgnify:FL=1|tara:strand:+ start:423 stop:596 length:174 start_codon:yes stop_codon:yes gene_type:complete